jgi:hypothetical protein
MLKMSFWFPVVETDTQEAEGAGEAKKLMAGCTSLMYIASKLFGIASEGGNGTLRRRALQKKVRRAKGGSPHDMLEITNLFCGNVVRFGLGVCEIVCRYADAYPNNPAIQAAKQWLDGDPVRGGYACILATAELVTMYQHPSARLGDPLALLEQMATVPVGHVDRLESGSWIRRAMSAPSDQ